MGGFRRVVKMSAWVLGALVAMLCTAPSKAQTYTFARKVPAGEGYRPAPIAFDASGNLYVASMEEHRIIRYSADLKREIGRWGSLGTQPGQFGNPCGVAVDATGNVYVLASNNLRVQKFDKDGKYLLAWGSWGTGNGQFRGPSGIAVDPSGNVFVTDSVLDRVQKFDSSGRFLLKWGSWGSGNG